MPPIAISEFITFLPAPNWEATLHFYEHILGLPCVLDQGDCRIYQVAGEGFIGFCNRGEVPHPPEKVILTLVSPEVEAWHRHLEAHGVPILKPPTYNERYQIVHLFACDPNGYWIEIQRFVDPRWSRKQEAQYPMHEPHAQQHE